MDPNSTAFAAQLEIGQLLVVMQRRERVHIGLHLHEGHDLERVLLLAVLVYQVPGAIVVRETFIVDAEVVAGELDAVG